MGFGTTLQTTSATNGRRFTHPEPYPCTRGVVPPTVFIDRCLGNIIELISYFHPDRMAMVFVARPIFVIFVSHDIAEGIVGCLTFHFGKRSGTYSVGS